MAKNKLTIDYGKIDLTNKGDNPKNSPKSGASSPKNHLETDNLPFILPKKAGSKKQSDKVYKEGEIKSIKSAGSSINELPELITSDFQTPDTTPGTTPGALRKTMIAKGDKTPPDIRKSTNQHKPEKAEPDIDNNSLNQDGVKAKPVKAILKKLKSFSTKKHYEEDGSSQPDSIDNAHAQLTVHGTAAPKHQEKHNYVIKNNPGVIDGFIETTVNKTMFDINQAITYAFTDPFFSSAYPMSYQSSSAPSIPVVTEVSGSSSLSSEEE